MLGELRVDGVATNQEFLGDLVHAPAFVNDDSTIDYVETDFLPRWLKEHEQI